MSEPKVPQIRGFPHSEKYFVNEYRLRDWLSYELRADGEYWLRDPHGLGELPPGSIVLFYIKNKIVGEAIVEQSPKEIEQDHRITDSIPEAFTQYVLFVPESIRAYPDRCFISREEFREMTERRKDLSHHFEITPQEYLLLMKRLAEKSSAMSR